MSLCNRNHYTGTAAVCQQILWQKTRAKEHRPLTKYGGRNSAARRAHTRPRACAGGVNGIPSKGELARLAGNRFPFACHLGGMGGPRPPHNAPTGVYRGRVWDSPKGRACPPDGESLPVRLPPGRSADRQAGGPVTPVTPVPPGSEHFCPQAKRLRAIYLANTRAVRYTMWHTDKMGRTAS